MSPAKAVWYILTTNCERATRLASQSLDRRLSLAERIALRSHEMFCRPCRRFHQQLISLRAAVSRRTGSSLATSGLSHDARRRLVDSLQHQLDREEPS